MRIDTNETSVTYIRNCNIEEQFMEALSLHAEGVIPRSPGLRPFEFHEIGRYPG